jgi:exopolysaccharide production protein ExoQ
MARPSPSSTQFAPRRRTAVLHAGRLDSTDLTARIILGLTLFYVAGLWWLLFFDPEQNASDASTQGSNVINQIIWISLSLLSIRGWAMARHTTPLKELAPVCWPFVAYLVYATVSVVWAMEPDVSARRLILQLLFLSAITLTIVTIKDRQRVLSDITIVLFVTAILNLIAVVVRPPTPIGHAGIYGQKNVLGYAAALMLLIGVSNVLFRRMWFRLIGIFLVVSGVLLVIVSQSKTSLGLAVIAPALAMVLLWTAVTFRVDLGLLSAVLVGMLSLCWIVATQVFEISIDDLLYFLLHDSTFSGRIYIWEFVGRYIDQRPFLGHGYNGFWSIGPATPALHQNNFISLLQQAHNGYLDILVELGYLGLTIFLVGTVMVISAVGRSPGWSFHERLLMFSLLLFILLHNLMESSIFRSAHLVWLFYVLMAVILASGRFMREGGREGRARLHEDGANANAVRAPWEARGPRMRDSRSPPYRAQTAQPTSTHKQ